MKKIGLIVIALIVYFFPYLKTYAQEKVSVYVFIKEDEEISKKAVEYINDLKREYSFNVEIIEVWDSNWKENSKNRKLADAVAKHFNNEVIGAPVIVIGNDYYDEFNEDVSQQIKDSLEEEIKNKNYKDVVDYVRLEITDNQRESNIWSIALLSGLLLLLISLLFLGRKSTK